MLIFQDFSEKVEKYLACTIAKCVTVLRVVENVGLENEVDCPRC